MWFGTVVAPRGHGPGQHEKLRGLERDDCRAQPVTPRIHARPPEPCIAEHEQIAALDERAAHDQDTDRGAAAAAAARTAFAAETTVAAAAAGADLGDVMKSAGRAAAERATGAARSGEPARAAVTALNRVVGDRNAGRDGQHGDR